MGEESGLVVKMFNAAHEAKDMVARLFEVASPAGVYSEPVKIENTTIITASEVSVSMGYGVGMGMGAQSQEAGATGSTSDESAKDAGDMEGGGGGGGGGFSTGRPVAVIAVGPDGVHVEPVFDLTKVVLAFFTAIGSMALMFSKMRKSAKGE